MLNLITNFIMLSIFVVTTGCGVGPEASSTPTTSLLLDATDFQYTWQPLGNNSDCVAYKIQRITDNRVSPPVVIYEHQAAMAPCTGYSRLVFKTPTGETWFGRDGSAQIRNINNLCLTNPIQYSGVGTETGKLIWDICKPFHRGDINSMRQFFDIGVNSNGAYRVSTRMQAVIGFPNPQEQCIERPTPTALIRTACTGLNNWSIIKRN